MAWINILDTIYPVGAIYMSIQPASPASFIGGTWTPVEEETFLCSANSEGALQTGGQNTVEHSHSAGGMVAKITPNRGASGYTYYQIVGTDAYPSHYRIVSGAINADGTICGEGVPLQGRTTTESIDNRPKYITVYIYYRTA